MNTEQTSKKKKKIFIYAHDCLYCNYANEPFFYSYAGDSFK